jgi:subtilisin family serine protease
MNSSPSDVLTCDAEKLQLTRGWRILTVTDRAGVWSPVHNQGRYMPKEVSVRRVVVMLVLVLAGMSFGLISPSLQEHLGTAQAAQKLPVQIVLKEQFDKQLLNSLVDGMPKVERRVEVARILSEFSAQKQAGVLQYLATVGAGNVKSFWVINAVYCEATPEVIRQLSERPEVSYVNYDLVYQPNLLEPEQETDGTEEIAWGVDKINAPAVWALGYTGAGIVCGHIDTGVDYNHADLADHMWTDANYPNHGWNFENNNNDPMDVQGHGTHTAGSVASDGTSGSQCGVAPDAQIMGCRVRTVADSLAESQCWDAMQFVVAPPLSPSNGADLYTMSLGWMISWAPHQASWRTTADNVNAAGVSQIVAAGNERGTAIPNACRCPGNVPPPWWNPENTGVGALSGIVSIGATDVSDNIASFSSPGPVTWSSVPPFSDYPYPPGLTRPDVSAPGVDVKSCAVGGGYTTMSGTSMATPHTAGAVCLMLSKNPNLSPAVVDSILEVTAIDLGPGGKDNDFGAGRIDALAAVNYVTGSGGPMLNLMSKQIIDSTGNNNGILDPSETAKLLITLRNSGGAACNDVSGTFRSYDARLTVSDSTGDWGNIPSGNSVTNTADWFTVHADGAIPPGTSFTCSLFVHGDSADYDKKMPVLIVVGVPPRQPGEIIWGPLTAPGMPVDWGLYGLSYNTNDNLIYASYMHQPTLYKYSSDSALTLQGTVTLPNDSCTDLDYITYADAFWVVCNPQKIMYKISPTGTVLSQFSLSFMDYPCGVTEDEAEHKLYISDRRTALSASQLIYVTDTLGNVQDTITHPLQATYGTRCLALDGRSPANPPSLLNIYTWFDASGTILDSCGMYEIDRVSSSLLNGYVFTNAAWNIRGIENDPRDGSYWITIMQGGTTENMIFKVVGFNYGTGVEEPKPGLPGVERLAVRAMPNPFTGRTNLWVQLPAAGSVDLKVYDNNGRVVRTLASGTAVGTRALFPWDGRNERGQTVAPGIYFYRVKSATAEAWGKVVLSR